MGYRATEKNLGTTLFRENVQWTSNNLSSILTALPIIMQAFLCSFNMISVHCSLKEPTRERVREVIHKSVSLSFLLMYIFGLAGYLYAYADTDGNILLNFDPSDKVIFVGRIGCGITTLFALPMNLLPCREAFVSLMAQIGELRAASRRITKEEQKYLLQQRTKNETKEDNDKKRSHARTLSSGGNAGQVYDSILDSIQPTTKSTKSKPELPKKQEWPWHTDGETLIHWGSTCGILLFAYIAAVLAPGVAIVWDFTGSSMAFLLQFIIPAVCYIQLKTKAYHGRAPRLARAWTLLVVSIFFAVVCTAVVIRKYLG
jgi:amino acid permease